MEYFIDFVYLFINLFLSTTTTTTVSLQVELGIRGASLLSLKSPTMQVPIRVAIATAGRSPLLFLHSLRVFSSLLPCFFRSSLAVPGVPILDVTISSVSEAAASSVAVILAQLDTELVVTVSITTNSTDTALELSQSLSNVDLTSLINAELKSAGVGITLNATRVIRFISQSDALGSFFFFLFFFLAALVSVSCFFFSQRKLLR
jgi:hypothetical protein